MLTCFELA